MEMATPMEQEWAVSGSACCSPLSSCLLSWCLPCVQYGRIHHRLHKDPQLRNWSCCNIDCCGYYLLSCCGLMWIIQMMQRGEIRKKYGLKGNGCKDCLCACCCTPCDLMQQDKEIQARENEKSLLVDQQPAKQGQMYYDA